MRLRLKFAALVAALLLATATPALAVPSPYHVNDTVGVAHSPKGNITSLDVVLTATRVSINLTLAQGVNLQTASSWGDGADTTIVVEIDGGGASDSDFSVNIRYNGGGIEGIVIDRWPLNIACPASVAQPGGTAHIRLRFPRSCLVPGASMSGPGAPPYVGEPNYVRLRVAYRYDKNADGTADTVDRTPDGRYTPAIHFPA